VHASRKALMEANDDGSLIIGKPEEILDQQHSPHSTPFIQLTTYYNVRIYH